MRMTVSTRICLAGALVISGVLCGCTSSRPEHATSAPQTYRVRPSIPQSRQSMPRSNRGGAADSNSEVLNRSSADRGEDDERSLDQPSPKRTAATSSSAANLRQPSSEHAPSPNASGSSQPRAADSNTASGSRLAQPQTGGAVDAGDNVRKAETSPPHQGEQKPSSDSPEGHVQPAESSQGGADEAASCGGGDSQQQGAESTGSEGGVSGDTSGDVSGGASGGASGTAGGTESLPELAAPSGSGMSAADSQKPSDEQGPPVFRDGGTGASEQVSESEEGIGERGSESAQCDSASDEQEASSANAGDESGGDPLHGPAGSADAIDSAGERAKDAGWAVRPESMDERGVGEQLDTEGHGGGQAGSSTGGLMGDGAGGSDGSGETEGGGEVPGERAGTPGIGQSEQDPSVSGAAAAQPSASEGELEDGSLDGQSAETVASDLASPHGQRENSESSEPPKDRAQSGERLEPDEASRALPATPSVEQFDPPPAKSQPAPSPPIDASELAAVTAPPQPMGSESWHRQVRGAWRLVTIHDPDRDFLPGGASERFIGIDPTSDILRAVLSWNGDVSVSMAAEYFAGFRPRLVEIQPVPHAPSAFPAEPGPLLGGGTFTPATSRPPCELKWVRDGDRLIIGGAEYEPADPDVMIDLLSQPEPVAPDGGGFVDENGDGEQSGQSAVTVDFFGVQAEGRYFCYIVDVSGSMDGNGGMLKLRMELERSLASLPPGTRFAVLPFNSKLRNLQPHWISASPHKARDIGHRLSGIRASGGTNPAGAFSWAFQELRPQPDAIFFMTDGQIRGGGGAVLTQLKSLNASNPRTRIHAIGLGNSADAKFLQRVADDHGGTYRSAP